MLIHTDALLVDLDHHYDLGGVCTATKSSWDDVWWRDHPVLDRKLPPQGLNSRPLLEPPGSQDHHMKGEYVIHLMMNWLSKGVKNAMKMPYLNQGCWGGGGKVDCRCYSGALGYSRTAVVTLPCQSVMYSTKYLWLRGIWYCTWHHWRCVMTQVSWVNFMTLSRWPMKC